MDRISDPSSTLRGAQAASGLPVDAATWLRIEAGLLQRMRVLERVAADVYGPQRLVAANLLPPALVQGHPGYCWALRRGEGEPVPGGRFLHLAAFDLACDAQGHWWVLSQRTQAAWGLAGLSDLLSQGGWAPGLMAGLQAALHPLAQPGGGSPRLVMLTQGGDDGSAAARLARHLGMPCVTGAELSVRGEQLCLRGAAGLEPVQGLLNALADDALDPLELRANARSGVPGLMQALRAGRLLVANGPGTAFLESPALLGFLPGLTQHLLGETLSLPSLPTWWCGERAALDEVLPRLAQGVIRPTDGGPDAPGVDGRSLSAAELADWAARLRREPEAYTVQTLLTAPPPTGPARLRAFAVTDGATGWRVLPASA